MPFFFSFHTSTFQLLGKYPRLLPLIFIVHRVHQSHCSSIFHRVPLTHALALSASQFVHKKILGADNLPPAPVILLLRKKKRFLIGTTSTMERYIVAEQTQQINNRSKRGRNQKKKAHTSHLDQRTQHRCSHGHPKSCSRAVEDGENSLRCDGQQRYQHPVRASRRRQQPAQIVLLLDFRGLRAPIRKRGFDEKRVKTCHGREPQRVCRMTRRATVTTGFVPFKLR